MRRALLRGVLAAALLLAPAGCGGEDEPLSSPTVRNESPSLAPSATPTPTQSPTEPTATAPSAPSPPPDATGPGEEGEGGAGDEEAIRSPVRVVIDGEGVTPPRVEAPAFLGLRVTVRNDLPRRVTVALRGAHRAVRVAARSERTFDVPGLQPGEYPIDAGAAGRATLVAVLP